jgi:hypothetical protein
MFKVELEGDWDVAEALTEALANEAFVETLLEDINGVGGEVLCDMLKATIDNGRSDWLPLSVVTITVKGHDKPLVGKDSSDIRDGITVIKDGVNVSVGIPEGTKTRAGDPLDVVAAIQEFGAVVPVTHAMRGWFAEHGFPLRPDTVFITIPRRALFAPVFEENRLEIQNIMTYEALDFLIDKVLKNADTLSVKK